MFLFAAFVICLPLTTNYETIHLSNLTYSGWKRDKINFSVFDQLLLSLYEKNKESTNKQAFIVVDPVGKFYLPFVPTMRTKRSSNPNLEMDFLRSVLHYTDSDDMNEKSVKRRQNYAVKPPSKLKRSVKSDGEDKDLKKEDENDILDAFVPNGTVVAYPVKNFNPYVNVIILAPYIDQNFYSKGFAKNNVFQAIRKTISTSELSQLAYFSDALALLTDTWISWTRNTPAHDRFMT